MGISRKQKKMLAFIEDFMEENRYPPTLEEIRVGLNISSKSLVNHHLEALENAAFLSRSPNKSRGIRLVGESDTVRVPFMIKQGMKSNGKGKPSPQQAIELTSDIVPNRDDLYALKVPDDSLIDAFINEGDVVIMQRQNKAKNGEMVAVRLVKQNATLLKRFYRENGHVRLQPADPTAETMIVDPKAIEIQGKVVAVIRQVS
jgi:repressor LexA